MERPVRPGQHESHIDAAIAGTTHGLTEGAVPPLPQEFVPDAAFLDNLASRSGCGAVFMGMQLAWRGTRPVKNGGQTQQGAEQ